MNTRQAIQPSNRPAVLSIAFSTTRTRFIAGLSEGCRIFRTDNCLTTYQPCLSGNESNKSALVDGGVGVADVLDDRFFAFAGGGRLSQGSPNVFEFWDATLGKRICSFDLHERLLGIKLSPRYAAVVLSQRIVLFEYQELVPNQQPTPPASPSLPPEAPVLGPSKVKGLYPTAQNPYALAVLRANILILPAQSTGQVQLVPLPSGSTRVLRAHNTALRALTLSDDGTLVATASRRGTLVRVFDTSTLDQIAEFRRGVDHAIIYSLALSPGNRWLACTSDKGTLHVFDLRPNSVGLAESKASAQDPTKLSRPGHRKSTSHPAARIASSTITPSLNSTARSSSPASATYQGSVQEYYGLLPPPPSASSTSHSAAASALSTFKNSSLAPRVLRDVRSVASAPFWLGDEETHWQGGAAFRWTTRPDGNKVRVREPVPSLANEPSGRPVKGVVAFAPGKTDDDNGAQIYVVGGGGDARWELFDLLALNSNPGQLAWGLMNQGFRKYLTRQFVD